MEITGDYVGGMFGLYLLDRIPTNYVEAKLASVENFNKFFHGMLKKGVYFAPSMYEAGFISIAHDQQALDVTIKMAEQVFADF